MRTPFGRERLSAGTVGAIQNDNPLEGLGELTRTLTAFAAEERADWERQQTANARAKAYELADQYQKKILEGKAAADDGRPWTEEDLVNQFDRDIQAEIERLHSTVRSRAQGEVAQTAAVLKAGLRGQLRDYHGQIRQAELRRSNEIHLKASIDAPDDGLAAIPLAQAVKDIKASLELTPVQKEDQIEKFQRAVWETRLDKKLDDPSADLEALRKWVDGLDISVAARESMRNTLETRGVEVGRGHASEYMREAGDRIVTAATQAREPMIQDALAYLDTKKILFKPEELAEIKQKFEDGVRRSAFLHDMAERNPGQIRVDDYGFRGDEVAWAREKVKDAQYTAEVQRQHLINLAENEKNEAWNRKFDLEWMEIVKRRRDDPDHFSEQEILNFQARVEAAQYEGFSGARSLWFQAEAAREQWQEQRRVLSEARGLYGSGTLSQEQAEAYWPEFVKKIQDQAGSNTRGMSTLAQAGQQSPNPDDVIWTITTFAQNTGRLPNIITKRIEAAVNSPNAEGVNGQAIREMAQLYKALRDQAPGVAGQIDGRVRSFYDALEYDGSGKPLADDSRIKAMIKSANDPSEQERRNATWMGLEKDLRKTVNKALSKGPEGLKKYLDMESAAWPGMGIPGDDADIAEVEEEILRRAKNLYTYTPNGRMEDVLRNAAVETFTVGRWGVWNGEWMQDAPSQYFADTEWFMKEIDKNLQKRGMRISDPEVRPFNITYGLGALSDEQVQLLSMPQVRVRLEPFDSPTGKQYWIYTQERGGDELYELLTDEMKQPVVIRVDEWVKKMNDDLTERAREAVDQEVKRKNEREKWRQEADRLRFESRLGGMN